MNFNMKKLNQFKNSNFKLDKWHTGSQSNDFRTVKESFFVKGISISLGATIVCLENKIYPFIVIFKVAFTIFITICNF